MKKTSLILSMTLALAACQQEELAQQEVIASPEDFVATVEEYSGATKTSLNEKNQILWSEDDQISIFNGDTQNKCYQISSLYPNRLGATFSYVPGAADDNDIYELNGNLAVYPYSEKYVAVGCFNEEGTYQSGWSFSNLVLPEVQEYAEGSFANGSFPMVALTTDKNDRTLSFKNLLGLMRLDIRGEAKVASIKLTSGSQEIISGTFIADVWFDRYSEPNVFFFGEGADHITLDCGEGVQLDTELATSFYFSLPPTVFENGFSIEITDTEGYTYLRDTKYSNEVQRSGILVMPSILLGPAIKVVEDVASVPTDGTATEITVKATKEWEASYIPEWLEVTPSSGPAGETKVSVSMKENYAEYSYTNTYIEFNCIYIKDRITVLKDRSLSTCEEVIAGAIDEEYRVCGHVMSIDNWSYGNWTLQDDTGNIYIYGTALEGVYKKFDQFNINVGDIVTVQGPKAYYNGIIRLEDAAVIDIKKSPLRINYANLDSDKIPIEGTEFYVSINCEDDFTVNIQEEAQSWLTMSGMERVSDQEVHVYFTAAENNIADRLVKLMFEIEKDGTKYFDHMTLHQEGPIIECTFEEFLNAPANDYVRYRLTGVIDSISSTVYGNFHITDGVNTLYVYGMTNKGEIGQNDKSFSSIGLQVGDTVTLVGVRGHYGGTPQVGSSSSYQSYYVSHTSPNE